MLKYLITVSILFFALGLQAQSEPTQKTIEASFGLKGGVTFSDVTPSRLQDHGFKYLFGIVGHFKLNKQSYVLTELLLSRANTSVGILSNVEIPILYKTNLNHWLSLELGPQLNFNVHETSSWRIVNNQLFASLCAGLAFNVDEQNYFNFRYAKGVTPIFDNPKSYSTIWSLSLVHVF